MTETATLRIPDASSYADKARDLSTTLGTYRVIDDATYQEAARLMNDGLALIKIIDADCDPLVSDAFALHRKLTAFREKHRGPVERGVKAIKAAMGGFVALRKREREEAERKLLDEQRRAQEERLLAQAEEVKAETGSEAAALDVLEQPVETVRVRTALPELPAVDGVSTREHWTASVTDKLKLIRFVAANPQFANILDANESALNGLARSLKSALAIEGVEVHCENVVVGRGARASA